MKEKEWRVSDLRIGGDGTDKVVLATKLKALEADGWTIEGQPVPVGDTWMIFSSRLR